MVTKLSLEQVNSFRLSRHHLSRRVKGPQFADVVSDVCGVQAQVLSAAELAVRARVEGVTRMDVEEALWKRHEILKTWCMRGTLHLLASADLPLYVAALKSKLAETVRWLGKDGSVTPAEVESITDGIRQALAGSPLTREGLSREVERRVRLRPETKKYLRSAWGVLLSPAAYQGALAFGESRGQLVTFASPARWVPRWEEPPFEDALAELFRRFVRAYGPVAVNDFGHWWGGLRGEDRSAVGHASAGLEEVEVRGFRGLMHRSDAEEASGLGPTRDVHLLPSFDCYPMFFAPRERFVAGPYRGRIFRKTAGWNYPALVIDGAAAGTWSLRRRKASVEFRVEPFRRLDSRERRGVKDEADDIALFLEAPGAEVRFAGPA